jgi:ribosomal protein S18 acetylase RimI-like enzyme
VSGQLLPLGGPEGSAFDAGLLSRIEDAGLNAAAPPQQRVLGGWLLRLSPGKAKRARCVNAIGVGQVPVDELLTRAEAAFADAGLPFIVRVTPFSQPSDLDALLAARGLRRFDDTRVMVRSALADLEDSQMPDGLRFEALSIEAFADLSGRFRGSPEGQRNAHAERMRSLPVRAIRLALSLVPGAHPIACAQAIVEDELVGLYDVHVDAPHRGRGHAGRLCSRLMRLAQQGGARTAYLQVEADNAAARALYAKLGFHDGYTYHYRTRDPHAT